MNISIARAAREAADAVYATRRFPLSARSYRAARLAAKRAAFAEYAFRGETRRYASRKRHAARVASAAASGRRG